MNKLTRKEEEVMKILWQIKKAFVKDILDKYPPPQPHYNTISTIIRTLQEKGIVGYKAYGKTYEYYPLISKEEYRKLFMKQIIKDYFDNSYKKAVSFFIDEQNINQDELDELIDLINNKK